MPSEKKKREREVDALPFVRPRFGRLSAAVDYSGICRSKIYQFAETAPELFRRNGSGTLVDFDVLDRLLDALPVGKDQHKQPPSTRLRK